VQEGGNSLDLRTAHSPGVFIDQTTSFRYNNSTHSDRCHIVGAMAASQFAKIGFPMNACSLSVGFLHPKQFHHFADANPEPD
jgi:hypothetical protein